MSGAFLWGSIKTVKGTKQAHTEDIEDFGDGNGQSVHISRLCRPLELERG